MSHNNIDDHVEENFRIASQEGWFAMSPDELYIDEYKRQAKKCGWMFTEAPFPYKMKDSYGNEYEIDTGWFLFQRVTDINIDSNRTSVDESAAKTKCDCPLTTLLREGCTNKEHV